MGVDWGGPSPARWHTSCTTLPGGRALSAKGLLGERERGFMRGAWAQGAPSGGHAGPSATPAVSAREHVFFSHLNFSTQTAASKQQVLCFGLFSCRSPRKANK